VKLRTRARYSVRLMMTLARHSRGDKPVGLGIVAEKSGLSRGYLEQLVVALRNAHLLRSVSGRKGGYLLARSPEQIRVGEIVEAASGPIEVTDCVADVDSCMHAEFCTCRPLWELINLRIIEVLYDYTLADLLKTDWSQRVLEQIEQLRRKIQRPPRR